MANNGRPETFDFLPAESGERRCAHCGMLANLDPDFHAERYGHMPSIRTDDGRTWTWSTRWQTFVDRGIGVRV